MGNMTVFILGIAVLSVGTYLMRLGGAKLGNRLALSDRSQALLSDAATVLLFSVALATTFYEGEHFAGMARVLGVAFAVFLGSVGIPLEGLAFIAGVDRILDMARTALNVVGNALAVLVIAKWEHKFDRKKALAYEREVLGRFDKTADQ